jgi:hypothetical protein
MGVSNKIDLALSMFLGFEVTSLKLAALVIWVQIPVGGRLSRFWFFDS